MRAAGALARAEEVADVPPAALDRASLTILVCAGAATCQPALALSREIFFPCHACVCSRSLGPPRDVAERAVSPEFDADVTL